MRYIIAISCFAAVFAAFVTGAPPAAAQSGCETVQVQGARLPRVQLYNLDNVTTPARTATQADLSAVGSGRACAAMADYLMIELAGQRWLVRRSQMVVSSGAVELPPCSSSEYASQAARNASSSGLGGAACRSTDD